MVAIPFRANIRLANLDCQENSPRNTMAKPEANGSFATNLVTDGWLKNMSRKERGSTESATIEGYPSGNVTDVNHWVETTHDSDVFAARGTEFCAGSST